jgi:hypothetical protein
MYKFNDKNLNFPMNILTKRSIMCSVNSNKRVVDAINVCIQAIIIEEPVCDAIDIRFQLLQMGMNALIRRENCMSRLALLSNGRLAASPSSIDAFIEAIDNNFNLSIEGKHWTEIVYKGDYESITMMEENLAYEYDYLNEMDPSFRILENRRFPQDLVFDTEVVEIVKTVLSYKVSCLNKLVSIVSALEMNIDKLSIYGELIATYESALLLPRKLSENDVFIQNEQLIRMMEILIHIDNKLAKILSEVLALN